MKNVPRSSLAKPMSRSVRTSILAGSILACLAAGSLVASAQVQVVNGGFETGDFFGWTQSGNLGSTGVDTTLPHSGAYSAYFGPVTTTGSISQNIRTFAGGTYTLTYFLANGGGTPNSFASQFNGVTLQSLTNAAAFGYSTQWTFAGLETAGGDTSLMFTFRQDPNYYYLDDVKLTLTRLVNSTYVSFGPKPDTLIDTGDYIQKAKGTLRLQVGGFAPNQHDLFIVGGDAKLDGTLEIGRLNNFHFKHGDSVTVLTADGKVSGEFATVLSEFGDTILSPIPVYHEHRVTLDVQTFEHYAVTAGLSPNQQSVAAGVDSVVFDSRASSLIRYLDKRSLSKLPGDFDRIAPDELTSIFAIGTSLANVQSMNIQRRTDDIRSGSNGFSAAGLAINGVGPSYSGNFGITTGVAGPTGNDGKEMKSVVAAESRWGVFLSGTGEWVSAGDTFNARGYDLTSGGFTLGVDYKVTPNFAIGLAAGYTGTTADLSDNGRVWVNGGKLGLYATFFQNKVAASAPTMSKDSSKEAPAPAPSLGGGFYADTAVFGGYNSYDTRRSALQGDARGDTDGGELNVLFGAGYDFKIGNVTFGPTASFNYTYLGTNGFTEHGSLAPLDVHGGKGDSLRTAFGFKVSCDWKIGGLLVRPELRAAWQHEYGDAAYALDSSFANGGGNSFTVNGPQFGRDSALLGAGFAIQCSERCSTYVYYDGELGRKDYQSTAVTGGFRISF